MTELVFHTVAEVAKMLRVSEKTVRRHVKAGKIRALRMGHTVRISGVELARLQAGAP